MANTIVSADRKTGHYQSTVGPRTLDPKRGSLEKDLFTIGDLSRDFNVSLRALRFYEDRGLLHPIRRGSTRLYTVGDRRHLELILRGKQLGFTLSEIHEMIDSHKDAAIGNLESALPPEQIAAQIDHLERQRQEIDEAIQALRHAHQKSQERWDLTHLEGSSA